MRGQLYAPVHPFIVGLSAGGHASIVTSTVFQPPGTFGIPADNGRVTRVPGAGTWATTLEPEPLLGAGDDTGVQPSTTSSQGDSLRVEPSPKPPSPTKLGTCITIVPTVVVVTGGEVTGATAIGGCVADVTAGGLTVFGVTALAIVDVVVGCGVVVAGVMAVVVVGLGEWCAELTAIAE